MGAKRKLDTQTSTDEIKIEQTVAVGAASETETVNETEKKAKKKPARQRSGKYVAVRAQIDKTKKYDAFAAVELLKKLSYSSFEGTVTAHVVVREIGISVPLTLPNSTGKKLRVAIANDEILKEVEAGKIEFDFLLSTPQFMGKLAKFASVLGPKGLMPNPKNNTLTANPELQKTKLEGGTVTVKTEKKAPLMHIRLGKTTMETKQLVENLEAVMKSLNNKIVRLVIASTMSPGIKVAIVEK